MRPLLKKATGAIAAVMLVVFEGAFLVAGAIGLSTTADDAQNLPKFVVWLLDTPWWVPSLVIPVLLATVATWAFWPDRSVEKAMKEYKSANDRAWAFEPEFKARCDQLITSSENAIALAEKALLAMADTNAKLDEMKATITSEIRQEFSLNYNGWCESNKARMEESVVLALSRREMTEIEPLRAQIEIQRNELARLSSKTEPKIHALLQQGIEKEKPQ